MRRVRIQNASPVPYASCKACGGHGYSLDRGVLPIHLDQRTMRDCVGSGVKPERAFVSGVSGPVEVEVA